MQTELIDKISGELALASRQVAAVMTLIEEGATVPFIARYRKEATGALDELQIIAIRDRYEELDALEQRREYILKSIEAQGKLSDELKKAILACTALQQLEDLYLPYKPKKRTRAQIAREKGLEEAATLLFEQNITDVKAQLSKFISPDKGVATIDEVLAGARDIIAESINENAQIRKDVRDLFEKRASISASVIASKEKEAEKYRDWFDWKENALTAPSHRVLAIMRAMEEGFLRVHFVPEEAEALALVQKNFAKKNDFCHAEIMAAAEDSYKRLMGPSLENEIRSVCKKRADEEAIRVFASNLRELLLASPLGQKCILALDPGLRTGCKVVVLNRHGDLLYNTAIYPLEPKNEVQKSADVIRSLCEKFHVEAISIGNGTGGREALAFVKAIGLENVIITMVNESGASVYSASEVARKEFPDQDITVRGAVSIGRRLMDPLSELVKIDPKAIGVGQYQHDVDQKMLKKSLDETVESCVNSVGVDVNTAGVELLQYVSGLSGRLAQSIVSYRSKNGEFKNRTQLKLVPGMGEKSFEQAAGFLRINAGDNPLDASAVHPESYAVVEEMAKDAGCSLGELLKYKEKREKIRLEKYCKDGVGLPTLKDIYDELEKPGRDPRREFELFEFAEGVTQIADLKEGMVLPGVVTNVTKFGAFVDIGVHQDGLVHISELSDRFVKDPAEVVKVNQKVSVRVVSVDTARKRIALSMKAIG